MLAAVGTTDAAFDPYGIAVAINGVWVCTATAEPDQPRDLVDLTPRAVHVPDRPARRRRVGDHLTNDLTPGYVHENSAYSS